MAETKTKRTGANVDAYLASRASPEQMTDCKAIMAICRRVTRQTPKMWGPSMELVVYLLAENRSQLELLAKLGKHRMTKTCLYFKRLADLNVQVLESLIAGSVAEVKRRYPGTGAKGSPAP